MDTECCVSIKMSTQTKSGYWDIADTGANEDNIPKILIMTGSIEIYDFNKSLFEVFANFCKKENLEFCFFPNKVVITLKRGQKWQDYIEQLKLFYL